MGILLNKSKNFIINGAMDFWQRGTSFASIANNTYFTDRFQYRKSGTAVHTASRSTDVPTLSQSGFTLPYSMRLNLTNSQNTLLAGAFFEIYQRIEGSVIAPLYGKSMTLSFWVKATRTGKYYISFRNTGGARSLVKSYDVLVTNTWEKKTITINHDTTGTWPSDTSEGLIVGWTIAAGSTFTAPSEDVWYSANYNHGPSQVNGVQTGSTDFFITGIQLEEGVSASNFERAGGEKISDFDLCLRYFEKSYDLETPIGTSGASGGYSVGSVVFGTTSVRQTCVIFRREKRGTPVVTSYAVTTGAIDRANFYDSSAVVAAPVIATSFMGFYIGASGTLSGKTANNAIAITGHYTADAEL
jgi:hypothetical protein